MIKYLQLQNKNWLENEVKNKSLRKIAKEIGCSYGGISWAVKKFKIIVPERSFKLQETDIRRLQNALRTKYPNGRWGKNAANWKGGRIQKSSGYIMIYKPEHPRANKDGYVMEHILIAEKMIGRYLKNNEIVHHKNGNKSDNRPENLEVATRKRHAKAHFEAVKYVEKLENEILRLRKILDDSKIPYW